MSNAPPDPPPGSGGGWQPSGGGYQSGAGWQQQQPQPPGAYGQVPPGEDPSRMYPPPPPPTSRGRGFTVASFVLAGLALVAFPIILGLVGIALGGVGMSKGDPLGKWAMGASGAAMVVGMVLAFVVFQATD